MAAKKGHLAIIGAGLSGALTAAGLLQRGYQVDVFDKSRGTGGRLASARFGEGSMDLGAPCFSSAQRDKLLTLADGLREHLQPWQVQYADFANPTNLSTLTRHVCVPRNSALTRALLQGAQLHTSTRVGEVVRLESGSWILKSDGGEVLGEYTQVVVAVPAPQATPLLTACPDLARQASEVRMTPLWVMLVQLEQAPERLQSLDWLEGEHPVLGRIVRDGAKPGRSGQHWFIQASDIWSERHVDSSPEQVRDELLQALEAFTEQPVKVVASRVHRWLYAQACVPTGNLKLMNGLHVCGDWTCTAEPGEEGLDAACLSAARILQNLD
ncbi:NAD(P)/FAD-dependent oxidoreductase [Marinobacterium stanieri]|uniref:NAD(P)/FAD-dependent oxidoreductase n=1 Tax=Marinobacterium stanieri TaxID=49186 RepID=UPI00025580F2|nr:FAD-dependent oxidoreductase [Marinobacterium stanieri]